MFVWVLGRNGELLDSHLFFFDRYSALADYHRSNRRLAKAAKYVAIAEAHYQAAPDDGGDDEPAAAMAMPVPRPAVNTKAVSTTRVPKPPTERPSGLMPSPASELSKSGHWHALAECDVLKRVILRHYRVQGA